VEKSNGKILVMTFLYFIRRE